MDYHSNYLLVSNVSDASFAIGVAHARSLKIDISDIVGLKTFVNSEFSPRFLLDDPTEENLGFGLQGKSVYILSTSSAHYTRNELAMRNCLLASAAKEGDVGPARIRTVLRDVPKETIGAFVTVEVRTLDEALAAAEAWAERMLEDDEGMRLNIMLDNMGPELSRDAVLDIETRGLRGYVTIEASGNIRYENLDAWQSSKVDVISTSGLHRAAPPLDLTCIFEGV